MAKDVKFNIRLKIDGKEQIVSASTNVKQLASDLGIARDNSGKLKESLINYNQAVQMMQNVAGAVSQLANTLNSVTEESRAFASSMKAANTMAGKDAAGFERLKGQVSELSKTIPVARDQLANGLYQVISNGVPEDNWISYLEASARSSVGGIADIGEVVKVTSTIIKNYGLEWSAAQDIQDKIQLTAKNGVTSFEQLAAALPSVTGQAAQLGVSFSEMLGVMSTLTGVTGNTSEVATQLASVLTALTKESTKSQKMADQMGISFNAASIKAAGGLRNYLMELDKTVTAYTQKTGELKESVYSKLFGRAEALRLVNALTGQLSEKYAENIAALENSEGTMQAAYEDMASTGASKLQVLKNEWGKYTDWIANKVGGIQPILTFGSQMGMTIVSVLTLVQAFQKLHLTQMLMSKSLLRNIAAYALFGTNTRKASMAVNVMTNSFRSAATRAIALKIAIRGLLVTTGVGIALMALGVILEKLIGSMDKAGDSALDASKNLGDLGKAADTVQEAYDSTLSSTYSDLMAKYEKLKQEWKSLTDEHKKIAWIKENQNALNDLKISINSVADAENIFSGNTDAVVEAFTRRAKAAARMAQLTELYRKQIELSDKYATTKLSLEEDAARSARHAEKGEEIKDSNYRNERFGYVNGQGKWVFSEEGAKLYSGTDVSTAISLRRIEKQMDANDAEIKKVEAQFAAESAAANTTITPPRITAPTGDEDKKTKGGKTELSLIQNAKTYKDLTNNVSYYQQELEKCNATDTERIKALSLQKKAAEDAVQAFKDAAEAAGEPIELNSLEDYEKKLQSLRKKRQTATAEDIAAIDNEISRIDNERKAFELAALKESDIARLEHDQITTRDLLSEKTSYYNRLMAEGTEADRKRARAGLDALDKISDAWDAVLAKSQFRLNASGEVDAGSLTTMKDVDAAISLYTEQQRNEDASNIQKTQAIIDRLTKRKKVLELGVEIPSMQKEVDDINKLSGREYRVKVKDMGFDALTAKIKELDKLIDNPDVGETQRAQIEKLRGSYEDMRKDAVLSFGTLTDGWSSVKGIGNSIQSVTDALEGNGNAWQKATTFVDAFISLVEGINTVVQIIDMLTVATTAHAAAKTAESAAVGASAIAEGANAAGQEAAAVAEIPVIAANKAATASFVELAAAMYMSAHAAIPFTGFGIGSGFASSAAALVKGIGLMPFAKGAVISGPTMALIGEYAGAKNNPEVVAPLDKLRTMIEPSGFDGGKVRFEIDGRKLVGVLEKETDIRRRT